jgi:hypothetical protein
MEFQKPELPLRSSPMITHPPLMFQEVGITPGIVRSAIRAKTNPERTTLWATMRVSAWETLLGLTAGCTFVFLLWD